MSQDKKEKYLESERERRAGPKDWEEKRAVMAGRREKRGVEHTLWELHPLPTIPSYWRECVCPYSGWQRRLLTHSSITHTSHSIKHTVHNKKRKAPTQTHNRLALLAVAYDKNEDTHANKDTQDSSKHKHTHNQFASLWIALCSALCCVCLGPPAHFGTAAKREGEKKEGRRGV